METHRSEWADNDFPNNPLAFNKKSKLNLLASKVSTEIGLLEKVGLVGGTGDLGTALAVHLAKVYESVFLGSRNKEKAESTLRELVSEKGDLVAKTVKAATNDEVVQNCDIIIASVPYESALETLKTLASGFRGNQILISAAAAVKKTENGEFKGSTDSKSLAMRMREFLPPSVKVACAFQTIPANVLYRERENTSFDVLVASEDKETYSRVSALINSIRGLRALYVGSLEQSVELESLTSILLNIAIKNKLRSPSFKVESF